MSETYVCLQCAAQLFLTNTAFARVLNPKGLTHDQLQLLQQLDAVKA